jgi:hypothetical protein
VIERIVFVLMVLALVVVVGIGLVESWWRGEL